MQENGKRSSAACGGLVWVTQPRITQGTFKGSGRRCPLMILMRRLLPVSRRRFTHRFAALHQAQQTRDIRKCRGPNHTFTCQNTFFKIKRGTPQAKQQGKTLLCTMRTRPTFPNAVDLYTWNHCWSSTISRRCHCHWGAWA